MSEKFDSNLIINIKVSYFFTSLLFLMHLGGALLVFLLPLAGLLKGLLWVALVVSVVMGWRLHISRTSPHAITALKFDHEGTCSVRRGLAGPWHLCPRFQAVVTPWLAIFLFRWEGRCWPVGLVIAADAVEPEPFRRLRARLRLQNPAA